LNKNNFDQAIHLFPNPFSGELTLELDNAYDDIIINVRNVSGKLVSTQNFKSTKNITFEIKEARGVYIVEVSNQQGNSAKFKVIKKPYIVRLLNILFFEKSENTNKSKKINIGICKFRS
jgi:hypothetical protein